MTTQPTAAQLDAWRKLADAATRPPREAWDNELIMAREELSKRAGEIVPALLAAVAERDAEIARLRAEVERLQSGIIESDGAYRP